MRRVCITHAQAVTPLAPSLEATWLALLAGESAIREVRRFPAQSWASRYAAHVPDLRATAGESLLHALLSPLLDNLAHWPVRSSTHGSARLFFASTKAGIDILETGAVRHQHLLPQAFTDAIERGLGLERGAAECVSAACASGGVAIMRGAQSIALGHCHSALAVCADISSPFTFAGFSALGALSSAPCRPFDRGRDGLTLGEGAAALLLMSEEQALELGLRPLALLTGWGLASDARHITAPARDARGLIQAMRQALQRAGLDPENVAGICVHGTGTVYNDAMELTALHAVFPSPPPIFSAKGSLGHSMAACGGIEAGLCCLALRDRTLPPTVGCSAPEERAQGLVLEEPRAIGSGPLLSCNSGFGGSNVVLLLEQCHGAW
jgi:3-oxoacyl-(acyl-carrier-protein) synthase